MVVTAVGWRAHAALVASGGRARIVAALATSFYAEAEGALVWVGPPGTPLHGRAVVAAGPRPSVGAVQIALGGTTPWRPPPLLPFVPGIRAEARAVVDLLPAIGTPRGLARLLYPPSCDDALTARARPAAHALASACALDDPIAVANAARPLLGLGPGLTPSGDDYVGGVLFGRRLVSSRNVAAWERAGVRIVDDAGARTHPISARLLADLAAGDGWAPLHDLASALSESDRDAALGAARRFTTLGHTSGWDVFAGFLAGLGCVPDR